jgi:tetratricopeptide (TPR) repeat protein
VSLIAASGCSVGEFIASYFNTYYNAQRLFSEAEEEVWNQPDTRLLGRNLLAQFTIPSGTRTKFLSVIEKTSKLLQYHPESNLVDNALLMIGMSYYYQAEYPKAERKFIELLDGYPSSNLAVEAKLMLAYTSYKMNARDALKTSSSALTAAQEKYDDAAAPAETGKTKKE